MKTPLESLMAVFRPGAPPPASAQHVEDALEHVQDECPDPRVISQEERWMTLDGIGEYDDLSSWPEWRRGEFLDLDDRDVRAELDSFRGSGFARAAQGWIRGEPMPTIVVVVTPENTLVGDGRGRVSVALAAELEPLPVSIVTVECG